MPNGQEMIKSKAIIWNKIQVLIVGMGTKIQANTCLPQCYSVMDIDGNSSNYTKSVYQDDQLLRNGQYHYLPMSEKSSNGYFKYDLEVARQTILKHESIFRNQLQELHRLYKIQRDLMNEIKSGRLDKDHINAENSRSSPLFSAVPPEDAKRTWDVPHSSSLHSVIGHLSTSGTSTGQSPLRFIACKSMPVCPSFQDTGCLKNVEPIISTGMFVGRTSVSYPVGNPVRADGSVNANLGFQVSLKDFFINSVDGRTNCGSSWNEKGPLTNDSGAGKMRSNGHSSIGSCCLGNSPTSFQSVLAEPRNEFLMHCRPDEHNSAAPGKRTLFDVEISEGNNGQLGAASNMSNQNHKTDSVNSESLYASLWTKTCSTLGAKFAVGNVNDRNNERTGSLNSKDLDGCFSIGFDSIKMPNQCAESDPVKCFKSSDCMSSMLQDFLNTDSDQSENFQKKATPQHNPMVTDCQINQESPKGKLPWFLRKPQYSGEQTKESKSSYFMNIDSLKDYSHQFFNRNKIADDSSETFSTKHETSSPMAVVDTEVGRIDKVNDGTDAKKFLGFPISDMFCTSTNSSSGVGSNSAGKVLKDKAVLINQLEPKDFVLQKGLNNYVSGLRYHIDLNLSLDEEEAQLAPTGAIKIATTEIDLEAPTVFDTDDTSPKRAEVSLGNYKGPSEECVEVAAEAIIAISLSGKKILEDDETYEPLKAAARDSLKWFAEIISAQYGDNKIIVEEHSRNQTGAHDEESIPDFMDYFEFMTLKLKDMKEDSYHYKPIVLVNKEDGETGAAMLHKRPRRGQARRGKHDFQRDILPGLVSLSRHEVTEDLQTFEEILKAKSCSVDSSLSLRSATKTVRGKKRAAISPTKRALGSTPTEQSICRDLSLTGWGKRTKRLPRQRCPNVYPNRPLQCGNSMD
ncbi:uncharacterized protein LOC111367169 isoform X2 [Olea europaea var. sylvestris]|uniref:uncharacterized protein LOC111367169 isoform X2 n=1 Tax=Olea europaea var. sylvestris TaxID=158386 RepID=UPI000C1D3F17|nr:uncharacterized protein LOC111367169 isoform X2 [Olea europaea var. sylvestris]